MSGPRNVTPGSENPKERPEWATWTSDGRNRSFPWLGVLLVLVGAGLLIQYFVPQVSAGTLVLLALGFAFLAAWLFGGSYVAVVPGVLVLAVGVARLIEELNIYVGPGTTSLAIAAAFLVIWLLGYARGRPRTWPLWGAAIFGLIGFVQVSGRIAGIPELGALWPVLVIVVGVLVLLSARRRSGTPPARS